MVSKDLKKRVVLIQNSLYLCCRIVEEEEEVAEEIRYGMNGGQWVGLIWVVYVES